MQEEKDYTEVPQHIVAESENKKAKRRKTLPELPVYRGSANMKFIITKVMVGAPRKFAKFFDEMIITASEVSKSIGLADNSTRNWEERVWYINCAIVLTYNICNDFKILQRLNVIGRDEYNKASALAKSIVAQLVAWRDYTGNRGANLIDSNQL